MNFVVCSYSFPPRSGPECFCTARFASALAREGHSVHVVTMDHPVAISQATYDFLVDKRVKITRVPMKPNVKRFWPRLRYLTTEWGSANYGLAIKMLKEVLGQYKNPILISRSNPESSHIIAFHARGAAKIWIAHFSDPIPFGNSARSVRERLWHYLSFRWVNKAISACDGISLTCEEVVRFYHETYGHIFDVKPKFINYHIGDPALPSGGLWEKPFSELLMAHVGMLNRARGVHQIIDALEDLNKDIVSIRFIQVGECDRSTSSLFAGQQYVEILNTSQPGLGASVLEAADISFIPDVQITLPYVPFMPSKFVYQLFSDKPLVILTREGSPMHAFAERYPSSGLFVADYTKEGDLNRAIALAMRSVGKQFDRSAIRRNFTREAVAGRFILNLTNAFKI